MQLAEKKRSLHSLWSVEGIPNAPYPPKYLFIFRADTSLFLFILFSKFNFTYFSHNYHNYSMFRDVPECSGMFHVPGFIDGPLGMIKQLNFRRNIMK